MNQEWEKLGKDIRNIVEDAVNSQNFSQLNKTISNTVNEAVNSIQKGLRTAGDAVNQAAERQKNNQSFNFGNWTGKKIEKNLQKQNSVIPVDKKRLDLFQKNTSIKAGGLALTICGCILNVGLGIAVVVLCLVLFIFGGISSWNKDCTVDIISFIDWQCNDDLAREQYVVGVKTIS